jgi:integrase
LPTDVQRWIDNALLRGWTSEKRGSKRGKTKAVRRSYSRDTVRGSFRVFRTMTRDAMAALELQRDPTLRANSLSPAQLAAFLTAMRTRYPQHYALVVLLAYTGLRFCHASALHWDDWEEARGVLRVCRKQVRGKLGSVTRKKRAPKEYPVEPELAAILKEHRMHLLKDQAPGLAKGLMFPSTVGTYRTPNSLDAAWAKCLAEAQIDKRFTIHGLRYTFTDLVRLANVDAVVRRALTGHVTEERCSGTTRTSGSVRSEPRSRACCGWFLRKQPRTPLPPLKVGFQVGFRSPGGRRPVGGCPNGPTLLPIS